MPRDNKKRGRRAEAQKRKHEDDETDAGLKRPRIDDGSTNFSTEFIEDIATHDLKESYEDGALVAAPFYGLLDESELEYFRQADSRLENNLFEDDEDRDLFLVNVYKEVNGKELKMACSQSSSRLLERLMSFSSMEQLKALFEKFCGQFLYLVQHRFASHCCETLFMFSAPYVTTELLAQAAHSTSHFEDMGGANTIEDLFLVVVNELQASIGFLITDKFASHALRTLLLILSGEKVETLPGASQSHKKKEKKVLVHTTKPSNLIVEKRRVPESFLAALETMIRDSILNLDTNNLRALATHTTGNPMLQILLRLELTHFGKQRAKDEDSILRKLIPDDPPVSGTESATFLDGLTYDPVGSRLLETIIGNAPGKTFKVLYQESWKYRMGKMVRNDVASYVAGTILERLSKDDLSDAVNDILPQVPGLAERGRTAIIKTMIERSRIRGLNTAPIVTALKSAYSNLHAPESFSILKLLGAPAEANGAIDPCGSDGSGVASKQQSNLHASLLAQSMLSTPGPLADLILDSLQSLSSTECVELAKRSTSAHVLQSALTSPHASVIFRRKLIQHFYARIGELALHPSGSHVVDAIYHGTHPGLAFIRERCAEELAENEPALRDSPYGRAVWRNWHMDLYKRRRRDWVTRMTDECGNDGFLTFPGSAGTSPTAPGAQSHPQSQSQSHLQTHGTVREAASSSSNSGAGTGGALAQASSGLRDEQAARRSHGAGGGSRGGSKSAIQLARERFARTRGTPKSVRQGGVGDGGGAGVKRAV